MMNEEGLDEAIDYLNWEIYAKPEDLPVCHTSRHQRYRFPEAFGPIEEVENVLKGTDVLMKDSGKYIVAFTSYCLENKLTWELVKNEVANG